jgi:hypothetical protein
MACKKDSNPAPPPAKPLQIVISDITTTLTIYSFSVTEQSSSDTLINIYSQTQNKIYSVNVHSGDVLKLHYFLELEGLSPAVEPHVTFISDGVILASIGNLAGIVSGDKYVTVP